MIARGGFPTVLLLIPIVLTLWFQRAGLAISSNDGIRGWYGYRRNHRTLNFLVLAAWCALWDWNGMTVPVPRFVKTWTDSITGSSMQSALYWVLPLTLLFASEVIFYNANRKINGLHWSEPQVVRQGFWEILRYILPLLLIGAGFEHVFKGEFDGIFLILGALPIAAIARVRLDLALGFKSRLLKTGELRNRAFRLATEMEVELRRVYIVPQGKGHLTNAYAGGFGSISLTDTLSHSLSYKELNCIIVHELAHVKFRHVRGYLRDLTWPYVLLVVLLFGWPSREPMLSPFVEFSAILLPTLVLNFLSRLREYAADREEIIALGDPEASISSLAKLHEISHVPRQWSYFSELFFSHPSLERRARAIARAANLPDERYKEIMEKFRMRGLKATT